MFTTFYAPFNKEVFSLVEVTLAQTIRMLHFDLMLGIAWTFCLSTELEAVELNVLEIFHSTQSLFLWLVSAVVLCSSWKVIGSNQFSVPFAVTDISRRNQFPYAYFKISNLFVRLFDEIGRSYSKTRGTSLGVHLGERIQILNAFQDPINTKPANTRLQKL